MQQSLCNKGDEEDMTAFQSISADPNGPEAVVETDSAIMPGHTGRIAMINPTGDCQGKIGLQLKRLGFDVVYLREQASVVDSLSVLAGSISAIVLDWRAEGPKDGEFARALSRKAAELALSVLVFVASSRSDDIRVASDAGLSSILTIPCRLAELKEALESHIGSHSSGVDSPAIRLSDAAPLLESCRFRFRTPKDVEKLVPLISVFFPRSERTAPGITELMMNAIEHGNLEIGQDRKAEWVARGIYRTELLKRLQTPPYSHRWAELIVNRRDNGVMIVIMDEGCGFCWQDVIENSDAETGLVTGQSGDGLAKAKRDSFDDLRFNHTGNQVTAFVSGEDRA
jgi:DNA-binding response OmpR family regulator